MKLEPILIIGGGTLLAGALITLPINSIILSAINSVPVDLMAEIPTNLLNSSLGFNIGLVTTASLIIAVGAGICSYFAYKSKILNNDRGIIIYPLSAIGLAAIIGASISTFYAGVIDNNIVGMPIQHSASFTVFRNILHSNIAQEAELISSYGGIVTSAIICSLIAAACIAGCLHAACR